MVKSCLCEDGLKLVHFRVSPGCEDNHAGFAFSLLISQGACLNQSPIERNNVSNHFLNSCDTKTNSKLRIQNLGSRQVDGKEMKKYSIKLCFGLD